MSALRESTTLKFVAPAAIVLMVKFLVGGISIGEYSIPPMTATEFGTAFAAVMAIWLGREWRKDHYKGKDNVQ